MVQGRSAGGLSGSCIEAKKQKSIWYFHMKNDQKLDVELQQRCESDHLSLASAAKDQLGAVGRVGQVKCVYLFSARLMGALLWYLAAHLFFKPV